MTQEMNPRATSWDLKVGHFKFGLPPETRVSQGRGRVCPMHPAIPSAQRRAWHKSRNSAKHRSDKLRGRKKHPVTVYLCNQVRVPDDGADEEPVVCHFRTFLHLGSAQVKVHLVVGAGHGGQIEIAHPAELQLEGQGGLQVTVNAIFCKLQADETEKTDTHTHRHTLSRIEAKSLLGPHCPAAPGVCGLALGMQQSSCPLIVSNPQGSRDLGFGDGPEDSHGRVSLACWHETLSFQGNAARPQHLPAQTSRSQCVTEYFSRSH